MESSIEKQSRLNCYIGRGIDSWDCYTDCAFWNGEICTNKELLYCWDCLHREGEECGVDGHEIYQDTIAPGCFE